MRNSLTRYAKSTPEEKTVAENWMQALRIGHLADRKFSELSSGEQRLVMLARALAKQPELLVLDEPLHGLDREHKELVNNLICEMVRTNGSTLIFVSHYTEELPECVIHIKDMIQ